MTTTIYFVRHGEAENKDMIAYGRIPGFHLSKAGEERCKKLSKYFKDKSIVAIYTSPLERTFETANIIGATLPQIPIIHEYDLIEVDAIGWQGSRADQLFTNEIYEKFLSDSHAQLPGENLSQLAERMKKVTFKLAKKHLGKEFICVSHEFPILCLKLALQNQPLEMLRNINVFSASITKLALDGNQKLLQSDYIELQ